jgi:flavin-dependent dehydrogenase
VVLIQIDIIGGSLGGLSTAISLKQQNPSVDVIVHEKYTSLGYNHEGRRCGEAYWLGGAWAKWKPVGRSIYNNITTVETKAGDKQYALSKKPGTIFVLNRQEFICQLARDAERLGVIIHAGDRVTSLAQLTGDYIVDASGCPSVIKRELGFTRGIKGITYQQTLEECNWFIPDTLKFILTEYSVGYYWVFPRNPQKKEVNLGVGFLTDTPVRLKEALEKFKDEHGIEGKVNYTVGGFVPAGLQRPLRYKNILFVGDAGVGCFPFLGEGIYRALLSGEIAGCCLAARHPEWYTRMIYDYFIGWDVVGKTFLRVASVLNRVGTKSLFAMYHVYLDLYYSYNNIMTKTHEVKPVFV